MSVIDPERLSAILSFLPDGLVILGHDTTVVEVNDGFLQMTGFARAELVGRRSLFPHWPEDERPRLEAAMQECARAGAAERDLVLPRADGSRFPAIVSIAAAPGAYVVTVKDTTTRVRSERVRAALRRLDALTAAGAPLESILDRVVAELGRLCGGGRGGVRRGAGPAPPAPALSVPVVVAGEEWGALSAGPSPDRPLPDGMADVLESMAETVAGAVLADRARAMTVARAGLDPLVGLPDASTFATLVERELDRSRRYSRPLSLVLIDIDGFHRINERHGQAVGDGVLRAAAERLGVHVRASDWVGRTGGDEYAWLLPETDEEAARDAAARLRRSLAEEPFEGAGYLTASLGVSSSASAEGAADLYRQAEVALHWAKVSGRNRVVPYSFQVAEEVFSRRGDERAEAPSLRAMRALAWAVDAKDPHTHRHSARVADLAVQLATALGWTLTRAAQLREAGLVHDVGKIAVPDVILFKPGPLSPTEFRLMASHAEIGARIVADVLSPEQAAWVRAHHERWDGGGYPDGLAGSQIPEEARLLTLADCWDVIVSSRSYKPSVSAAEALDEVRRCSGTQFWPVAVDALVRLVEAGAIVDAENLTHIAPAGVAAAATRD